MIGCSRWVCSDLCSIPNDQRQYRSFHWGIINEQDRSNHCMSTDVTRRYIFGNRTLCSNHGGSCVLGIKSAEASSVMQIDSKNSTIYVCTRLSACSNLGLETKMSSIPIRTNSLARMSDVLFGHTSDAPHIPPPQRSFFIRRLTVSDWIPSIPVHTDSSTHILRFCFTCKRPLAGAE